MTRHDLDGILDKDLAQLDFARAVFRAGQPVAIPPLHIQPKQQTTRW